MEAIYQGRILRSDFPFSAELLTDGGQLYHWHDELELVCVKEGMVEVVIPGREYLLQTGQMLLIDSGEVHCLKNHPEARWLSVRFSPRMVEPRLFEGGGSQAVLPLNILRCSGQWEEPTAGRFRRLAENLYAEANAQAPGWQVAVRGLLFEMALMIQRELPQSGEGMARRDNRDVNLKKNPLFSGGKLYAGYLSQGMRRCDGVQYELFLPLFPQPYRDSFPPVSDRTPASKSTAAVADNRSAHY